MITDKTKTPVNIFIKEDIVEKVYEDYADDTNDGVVRYVREDWIPNEEEMLAFAEKESFWLDDRLCPYDRTELRSRSWLEGYRFAKMHQEIKVRNVYNYVQCNDESEKNNEPE
jgi:hypothetical protein